MTPQQNHNLKPPLEGELLSRIINKDMIVLDIGANTGSYTVFLASLAKHVYAFEPSPYNFKQLEQNTKDLYNIELFDFAVSDKLGSNTLYTCPQDSGMNRLYDSKWCKDGEQIKVRTTTIDSFTDRFFSEDKISFIKIDVEGYEYHVIRGAVKTIRRDKPIIIMMEWHPPSLEEAGTNPREFYNYMKDELGYDNPKHCYLQGYPTINTYEELNNYTRDIPAINILWQ